MPKRERWSDLVAGRMVLHPLQPKVTTALVRFNKPLQRTEYFSWFAAAWRPTQEWSPKLSFLKTFRVSWDRTWCEPTVEDV